MTHGIKALIYPVKDLAEAESAPGRRAVHG